MSDPASLGGLRSAVEQELMPGESVLWIGGPQRRRFRGEIWGEVALGCFLAGLTLVGSTALLAVLIVRGDWRALMGLLVMGLFGWHAVDHLRAPWRYRQILGRTVYAVTERRAIVLNGFGYSSRMNLCELDGEDQAFYPADIGNRLIKRRRREGIGDVVFAEESRDDGKRRYSVESGFFGVEGVDKLDDLLSGLSRKRARSDPAWDLE